MPGKLLGEGKQSIIGTKGLSASPDYIEPLLDKLKELRGLIEKMDLVQRSPDAKKKSKIIDSAIEILEGRKNSHQIAIVYHLIREILDYTCKHEEVTVVAEAYQTKLYRSDSIIRQEIGDIVERVTNSKFKYVPPEKFIWKGEMTNFDKEELLKLSQHPYWYRVIHDIYDNCGTKKSKTAERKDQLNNFLIRESKKLEIYPSQIPSLIRDFEKIRGKVSAPSHEPADYFSLGEQINKSSPKLNVHLKTQYDDFEMSLNDVLNFYGIFKLKPIGKLEMIDQIINE